MLEELPGESEIDGGDDKVDGIARVYLRRWMGGGMVQGRNWIGRGLWGELDNTKAALRGGLSLRQTADERVRAEAKAEPVTFCRSGCQAVSRSPGRLTEQ